MSLFIPVRSKRLFARIIATSVANLLQSVVMDLIKQTTRIYISESMRYKKQFISLWLMLPLPVIAQGIILPLIYAAIVDKLTEFSSGADVPRSDVLDIFLILVGIELFTFVAWRTIDYTMINFQTKVLRNIDRRVFSWLLQLSYTFHVNSFGGSLVARGRRFVNNYEAIFDTVYFNITPMIIRFIFVMIVLFMRAPQVAIVLLVWSVLFIAIQSYLTIKKMPLSRAAAKADSAVTANLADSITNISSVKSFGRDEFENIRFIGTTGEHFDKRFRSWRRDWEIRSFQAAAMAVASIAVVYLSIDLLYKEAITIGTVVLIMLYVFRVFDDLWNFGRNIQRIERGYSDAAEMTRTFNHPLEIEDPQSPEKPKIKAGNIKFRNVAFRYSDATTDDYLFDNFSLDIKAGSKVGLIGPSGGGKTTVTRLLLRLYDPDKGTIVIDGQNIDSLKQSDLRSSIAYVPQEPVLFHRSLAENIKYGNSKVSDADIKKAARDAHADTFIEKLPKKYDTLVGERGTKLSGGEKQRVAIARAMLKDAPLLVLDEATSALDSESERLIQDALKKLMKNRTTIIIAHRLSTIQNMDRIIVLDGGRVIEDGSHEELLKQKGLYSELWSHQSGGFINS